MSYDEESDVLAKTGETEIFHADSVIFAIGQSINSGVFQTISEIVISEKGVIEIDKNMMTGASGIFAGGDVIPGKRSVTHAIGHAKKAANCIDAYLRGTVYVANAKNEVANFKKLNTSYFKKHLRSKEVASLDEIKIEASRCFSCGNCFHCDNCYGYCPDNAIIKHPDGSLQINYDYCKGCGICASECPCGAIKMGFDS
jgi:2-oxoacid:acceptor oxidoreductase delta subunit (pyruvate/2-ketoisovalerate family)